MLWRANYDDHHVDHRLLRRWASLFVALAYCWTVGIGLQLYAAAFWLYGWYRVTAWIGWPVALLFVLLLPKGAWR